MDPDFGALAEQLNGKEPVEILELLSVNFGRKVAFSTSLGAEDQVITRMLSVFPNQVSIFTLDTGRMFQECYDILEITRQKYNLDIRVFFPDQAEVEAMVAEDGPNLFYKSVEKRKRCCGIRKINPLSRALAGKKIWITGLRREQSVTRNSLELVEYDPDFKLHKINPLLNWTAGDVWNYIDLHKIPVNELHARGYPSIGCMPCTRPVKPGDDIRSGRWWWEHPENRECGLHTNKS